MEDRRKEKREFMMFYSRVFDRTSGKLLGYLADMASHGMMLISLEEMPVEQDYNLTLELPEFVYSKQQVFFQARSAWCSPDVNTDFFDVGFQLVDISEEDLSIIVQMVKDFGLHKEKRGVF